MVQIKTEYDMTCGKFRKHKLSVCPSQLTVRRPKVEIPGKRLARQDCAPGGGKWDETCEMRGASHSKKENPRGVASRLNAN